MANNKGRDWTEWKKEQTGMRRLGSDWKAPPEARYHQQEETTTSITLPREFKRTAPNDKKEMVKWILVFIALMFVRKVYFEMTKHDKIKSESTSKSRAR